MKQYLVFDLETQRSANDVGGWGNISEMLMSVGVLWDSRDKKFHVYFEDQVHDLIKHLLSGPLVIGYNHIGFDYTVLSGYFPKGEERNKALQEFQDAANLDLLNDLKNRIGKRVKLEAVARPTLKIGKSADGLQALEWYKEYLDGDEKKLKMIADYCKQDVAVTRDLYRSGIENGEVFYQDREKGIQAVKVNWDGDEENAQVEESVQLSF